MDKESETLKGSFFAVDFAGEWYIHKVCDLLGDGFISTVPIGTIEITQEAKVLHKSPSQSGLHVEKVKNDKVFFGSINALNENFFGGDIRIPDEI